MTALAVVALVVFAYGLISARIERSPLTAPMLFVAAGMVIGSSGLGLVGAGLDAGVIGILAEATLVLLLYTDAIRIDLRRLRRYASVPARMLGLGLPLAVLFGAVAAGLMVPELGWAGAFALGAVLAPTDAALSRAVIEDERMPVRIRQAVNVESGLNDGLALPLVTVAAAIMAGEAAGTSPGSWAVLLAEQIGFGAAVGLGAGWVGGVLLDRSAASESVTGVLRQLATLSIGVAAFAAAEVVGGNGFVAAFAAGLAFGHVAREHCEGAYDFAEDEGVLLSLLTFLAFGAAVAGEVVFRGFDVQAIGYAVLSLTVVRMVPVGLSLVGSGLDLRTVSLLGWFGPRGLASILFGVFVLEAEGVPGADRIFEIVTWTVLLSVLAHGFSARPIVARYARWVEGLEAHRPEMGPAEAHPMRGSG